MRARLSCSHERERVDCGGGLSPSAVFAVPANVCVGRSVPESAAQRTPSAGFPVGSGIRIHLADRRPHIRRTLNSQLRQPGGAGQPNARRDSTFGGHFAPRDGNQPGAGPPTGSFAHHRDRLLALPRSGEWVAVSYRSRTITAMRRRSQTRAKLS